MVRYYQFENKVAETYRTVRGARLIKNNDKLYVRDSAGAAQPVEKLFTGSAFTENEDAPQSIMLGWDSIAVCSILGNIVTVNNLYKYRGGRFTALGDYVNRANVPQIVTRAVDTCTFFCIYNAGTCIIGHIDYTRLTAAQELLQTAVRGQRDFSGVCTQLYNKEETEFAAYINGLGNIVNIRRGTMQNTDYIVDGRRVFETDDYHFGHLEIGFCPDGKGSINIFGDITLRFGTFTENERQKRISREDGVPSFEFVGEEGLINAKLIVDGMHFGPEPLGR